MSSLEERCADYHRVANGRTVDLRELGAAGTAVADALPAADVMMRAQALGLLEHVAHPDPFVAAQTALLLGCFVEQELPAIGLTGPIADRGREEMKLAVEFHDLLRAETERLEETGAFDDDAFFEQELLDTGHLTVTRGFAQAAAKQMPRRADAYFAMETLWRPMIATLTRDAGGRREARADEGLREAAEGLRYDVASWLHKLLEGVDGERWIVLHPGLGRGYEVEVHELVDNWSLQPLLAQALVRQKQGGLLGLGGKQVGPEGGLPGERPTDSLVACLRGHGPQQLPEHVRGQWETSTHGAVSAGGALVEDLLENKVWNEGIPRDIPVLDGHRVVVLGPAKVQRSWNANRSFEALGSDITLERVLSPDEVRDWLSRCAAATSD